MLTNFPRDMIVLSEMLMASLRSNLSIVYFTSSNRLKSTFSICSNLLYLSFFNL